MKYFVLALKAVVLVFLLLLYSGEVDITWLLAKLKSRYREPIQY